MLYEDIRVDLPKERVVLNNTSKAKYRYVYYLIKSYRDNGIAKNERRTIGRYDSKTKKLIPNDFYFELFPEDEKLKEEVSYKTKAIGSSIVIEKIVKDLNLKLHLQRVFGQNLSDKILSIANYILCDSSIMYLIDDWLEENYSLSDENISSNDTTKVFQSINEELQKEFFKRWSKKVNAEGYIAYNAKSISTYATKLDDIEYFYDTEDLPEINLSLYYDQKSGLPIYYNKLDGSILDKTQLNYMMKLNEELGIKDKDILFVMNRDFYSQSNLKFMQDKNLKYIIGAFDSRGLFETFIIENNEKALSFENYDPENFRFSYKSKIKLGAEDLDSYMYHTIIKSDADMGILSNKIEKHKAELNTLETLDESQVTKYSKYLKINLSKDGSFTYEVDIQKINKLIKRNGFFLLLGSKSDLSAQEVLNIYRNKDLIEKTFDNFKNFLDGKRLRTHSNTTSDGKIFTMFISLIIRAQLDNLLKDYFKRNKNSSMIKVLKELSRIKTIIVNKKRLLASPLTKNQKEILSCFNLSYTDIIQRINLIK